MKLKSFDKNKKRKRMVLGSVVGIILVVCAITLYKTFAFYEEEKSFNILKGRVPEFSKADITLSFTIDGESTTDNFPNKSDGYIEKSTTCESGVTASWDSESWGIVNIVNVENNRKIKCTIDFHLPIMTLKYIVDGKETTKPEKQEFYETSVSCTDNVVRTWNNTTWDLNQEANLINDTACTITFDKNLTKYIASVGESTGELAYDGTVDNNLRYIGANPNNYVRFNNELWRIIGVMNNVPDSTGKKETRIKLIRSEDLGGMAWDTANTNNWNTSSLKSYLNGDYYNSLSNDAKSMISNITWNLGGSNTNDATASTFYTAERGTTVYSGRPTTGIGYIGLMYPSDYGFAVGGNVRSTCLSTNLGNYNTNNCSTNNWLYKSGKNQWTLTSYSSNTRYVWNVNLPGYLLDNANNASQVPSPVVYLNSEIKIKSGSGSSTEPFELGA